jgi:hypothetical protein
VDEDLRAAMRRAVAEEEGRRQAALARNETASLETRWVLSAEAEADEKEEVGLKVVRWGEEDDEDEEDDEVEAPWRASSGGAGVGRMRFGTWKAREVSLEFGFVAQAWTECLLRLKMRCIACSRCSTSISANQLYSHHRRKRTAIRAMSQPPAQSRTLPAVTTATRAPQLLIASLLVPLFLAIEAIAGLGAVQLD